MQSVIIFMAGYPARLLKRRVIYADEKTPKNPPKIFDLSLWWFSPEISRDLMDRKRGNVPVFFQQPPNRDGGRPRVYKTDTY